MNTYIAYSGGVESTTMLLLFGHNAIPIFTDTGWEHKVLYEWLDTVEQRTGHKITRVKPQETLVESIKRQNVYPSPKMRFCTREMKIKPMDKFLRDKVPCRLMIGLNADEQDRIGNHGLVQGVEYCYPLIELGMTRSKCIEALKMHNLNPRFPAYMRRGGCVGCFYKSRNEFFRMAKESPEEAYEVAKIEEQLNADPERTRWFSVRDGIPNMRTFLDAARDQTEMELGDDISLPQTPCGVFCNR